MTIAVTAEARTVAARAAPCTTAAIAAGVATSATSTTNTQPVRLRARISPWGNQRLAMVAILANFTATPAPRAHGSGSSRRIPEPTPRSDVDDQGPAEQVARPRLDA